MGRPSSLVFIAAALTLPFGAGAPSPLDESFAVGVDPALVVADGAIHGARVVRVDAALAMLVVTTDDPATFLRAARADPLVRWVEPDAPRALVADPPFAPPGPSQWPLRAIRAAQAWSAIGAGDVSAAVCVVDSGVRTSHQEFATARVLGGVDLVRVDAEPDDESGHGTTVAGVAVAGVRDGFGIDGVAEVGLYVAKALAADGSGRPSDVASGIRWCAERPTQRLVVSLSLGSPAESSAIRDALDAAHARGRLVVAAAGNDGCSGCVQWPARLAGVVAVGCTDAADDACSFASTGPEVEIVAPGVSVLGPSADADDAYRTVTGTSFSTPQVAAAAALLWAEEPSLAADDVRARLAVAVRDLGAAGRDATFGHGRLDLLCLVAATAPCDSPPAPADDGACDTSLPDLDGYVCERVASAFLDVSPSATALTLADDAFAEVATGFAFPFHGATYDRVVVHANGLVGFGALACGPCFAPALLPSPGSAVVAAYWADLDASAGGAVHVATLGAAPERAFVAQWTEVPPFGGGAPSTFQVVLEEDGDVIVRWRDADPSGRDHVTGIQDAQGATGTRFRFGAFAAEDEAVLFRPTPIPSAVPTAPGGTSATPTGAGEVTLSWRAAAGRGAAVTAYRVYRLGAAEGRALAAEVAPATRAVLGGLADGERVTWEVTAVNGVGEGDPSAPATAVAIGAPPAVLGVAARPGPFVGSVLVGWSPVVGPADAIVVERSTLDGPFERVAGVARDRASFVDTGLVPLLAYRYRVLAENAVATGPLSPEVCARANPWPTAECASDAVS